MSNKDRLENISTIDNRSLNQTKMLFELCDCDFDKLLTLLAKIKSKRIFCCPADTDEVNKILSDK